MAQEPMEKLNRAEALILQGEQQLKQAALDFGMQFAQNLRQSIEILTRQLRESLMQGDDIHIKQYYADLQSKLDELNQQMRQHSTLDL
jgi:molecular chaperone DnaK